MRKRIRMFVLLCALAGAQMAATTAAATNATAATTHPAATSDSAATTTYEIFVGSFADSNDDGTGDLTGILEHLDYVEDLGFDAIWTTPMFPSPTYHKYDVTDYTAIDPSFGTQEDFDALLTAMHDRGMKLYLDLPVNHTSSEHPWFQEAAAYLEQIAEDAEPNAADCPYLDYYNFTREKKSGYEPLKGTNWFYEARFWSGMPDLNLDNETVRDEIQKILNFWLERGVDGFRLDAVTSYYTEDEAATTEFLTWLVSTAKSIDPDCYIVGEAWEDQTRYVRLYSTGIDSLFDFAFSGQDGIIANVVKGVKKPAAWVDAMIAEEELYASFSDAYINAPFYTNHDMARSTGYYAYDDGSKTKLSAALNLLMPGNAYVYYGEELGMKGSGKDENKRAPMYWSVEADAEGMCDPPAGMDPVKMKFGSYEEQKDDEASIWNYYREAIALRSTYPAIADGTTARAEFVTNEAVAAFLRTDEEETLLIVVNPTEEEQQVNVQNGDGTAYELAAELEAAAGKASLVDNTLTLPAFGAAICELP